MVGVACHNEAHHAFASLVLKGLLPLANVIIERLARESFVGVLGVSPSGIGKRSACRLAIFTDRTLSRVFVVVVALSDHHLQSFLR